MTRFGVVTSFALASTLLVLAKIGAAAPRLNALPIIDPASVGMEVAGLPEKNGAALREAFALAKKLGPATIHIRPGVYGIDLKQGPIVLDWPGWDIEAYGVSLLLKNSGSVFKCVPSHRSASPWGGPGALRGLSIWTKDRPKSGALLSLDNCHDVFVRDITLSGGYQDIDVASSIDLHMSDIEAGGDNDAPGSTIVRFRRGDNPLNRNANNSEIVMSGFNLRSESIGSYTYGLVISNADGLQFSNGHVGFTSNDAILIQPGGDGQQLTGLVFDGVNADSAGRPSGVASGWHFAGARDSTGASGYHQMSNSGAQLCSGDGISITDAHLRGLSISSPSLLRNGLINGAGIHISAGTAISVSGGVVLETNPGKQHKARHIIVDGNARGVIVQGLSFDGAPDAQVDYDIGVSRGAEDVTIGPSVHRGAKIGAIEIATSAPTIFVADCAAQIGGSSDMAEQHRCTAGSIAGRN